MSKLRSGDLPGLAAWAMLLAPAAWAGTPAAPLPTAQEVTARFAQALGGEQAIGKHQSITTTLRYEIPGKHLVLQVITYAKPFKTLTVLKYPDGSTDYTGYDGSDAWNLDKDGHVHHAKPEVLPSVRRDADMLYFAHILRYFRSMQTEDIEIFDGRPCYRLKGINNWGIQNEQFYDVKTGLVAGYRFDPSWRGGPKGYTYQVFSKYADFDGSKFATRIVSTDSTGALIETVTDVSYAPLDDAIFSLSHYTAKPPTGG
ncbi:MAG TPA: hypothetical protein VGT99_10275 [Gammaproteobacteria bacterium]|nr:hypothetical protein [Gammaproteobacteria bacterium]